MMQQRKVAEVLRAKEAREGAGVRLHRGFGPSEVPRLDPFLLFDDFSSPQREDFIAGFPWHPHRGIETVTYVYDGAVRHRDSLGNAGIISGGDIQWMTAGSGIIHEEMPEVSGDPARLGGFQLWVNLPQKDKMISPRYQDIKRLSIPEISLGHHARAKVIAGKVGDVVGPVRDIMIDPLYLDISLEPERTLDLSVQTGDTVFVYLIEGVLSAEKDEPITHKRGSVIVFAREGDHVHLLAGGAGAHFLLVSGRPLGEPVAWRGPIVMNTSDEIRLAFTELEQGTFLSHQ